MSVYYRVVKMGDRWYLHRRTILWWRLYNEGSNRWCWLWPTLSFFISAGMAKYYGFYSEADCLKMRDAFIESGSKKYQKVITVRVDKG